MRSFILGGMTLLLLAGAATAQGQEGKDKADRNELLRVSEALESGSGANSGVSDKALIAKARHVTADQMKDPDTAKFRGLKIHAAGDIRFVCGEINAKNSYGGYVGFKAFLTDGESTTILEGSTPRYVMQLMMYAPEYRSVAESLLDPAIPALCR